MTLLPFLLFLLNFQGNVAMESELLDFPNPSKLQTYIVHVQKPEIGVLGETNDLESWHLSFIPKIVRTSSEEPSLLYSYRNVMSGFAARLTEEQVKAMEQKDGFIEAMPETVLSLQTTHTPKFLGLKKHSGIWKDSNFGKGVIIGVLDSGVTPGHPSFSDAGMQPPPTKWKGRCDFNGTICNNKLIGAKSFLHSRRSLRGHSPADKDGHGTHTASTAAGAFVKGADALGNAKGTAVGMAPLAHLAIYRVCYKHRCLSSDILAGLDAAIEDGVDVLSLSIGKDSLDLRKSLPFFMDPIAKGSFAAIEKGIFVSCSAGNSGPSKSTLHNEAPWVLTVGASTIDRSIVAVAKLGNGAEFQGQSLFQPREYPSKLLPLVYAGKNGNSTSACCAEGSFTNVDVKGKVVVCKTGGGIGRTEKGVIVKNAGGAAMILMNSRSRGFTTYSEAHVLPATHVSYAAGLKIKAYISSTPNPKASILFNGTIIGDSSSPAMSASSSRGPSLASPGILKPDITGPGVNILAAWPFPLNSNKNSKSTFNVIAGTSMSCPHLTGIAALIKSSHPHWSPAAIKSALMTTATLTNLRGKPILDQIKLQPANFFATGAGHVNPSKAADPGLVYDIQPNDYVRYLCGLYTDRKVSIIARRRVVCAQISIISEGELNYPSFTVSLGSQQAFKRTVTNVGDASSIYSAVVEAPRGVTVTVRPRKLIFSKVNQKMTYSVTFCRNSSVKSFSRFGQGYLKWVSAKHVVRSPISVKFNRVMDD